MLPPCTPYLSRAKLCERAVLRWELADEGVGKFYVWLVRAAVASNKANVSKCEYFLEVARTEAISPAVSLRREIFFLLPENRRGNLQMRFRSHADKVLLYK